MELWLLVGIAIGLVLLTIAVVVFLRGKIQPRGRRELTKEEFNKVQAAAGKLSQIEPPAGEAEKEAELISQPEVAPAPAALGQRLSKTRTSLFGRLEKFFGKSSLDSKEWEELEEVLLEADVGVSTTGLILNSVKQAQKEDATKGLKDLVGNECRRILKGAEPTPFNWESLPKPWVISIVGVNGVGKTTTIGKLARFFRSEGKTVLLGAADTFRAGAINQLRTWSEREGAQFVSGREGGDPGAVAFDACTAGKARGIDVVLLDTAGRLHTKSGLMDELKKVHRVMKKVIPEAPHETWLVLDGNLGQNSVSQAREFQKALELSGVIVTKLDGTAKGGAVLSIASDLGLPVRFIGVGESSDDFLRFDAESFVQAIVG